MAEVSMGTVYDMNKTASEKEELLNKPALGTRLKRIEKFIKETNNTYFMLLNKETANYTLFNIQNKDRVDFAISELKECLINRGDIVSINLTEDKNAYEIWLRNEDGDIAYFFFPYDLGVIEVV